MDMWLVFVMLILLTRFSQQESLVSGGGQWADYVPRGWIDQHLKEMGMDQASGQTEAPGVPAETERSNALLWRMLPYLT